MKLSSTEGLSLDGVPYDKLTQRKKNQLGRSGVVEYTINSINSNVEKSEVLSTKATKTVKKSLKEKIRDALLSLRKDGGDLAPA